MDPFALASRHIFIPVFDQMRGISAPGVRRELNKSQYLPEEIIRHSQWSELKRLLHYVYAHNRFYRLRFEEIGAAPDDFRSFADFSRFPVVTRDHIRNDLDMMISDEFERADLLRRRTGGSTGVPIQVYQDKQSQATKESLVRRHDSWASFLPGEKRAALWGDVSRPQGLARKIFNLLAARTMYLDTLDMSDDNIAAFARKIAHSRIRLLFGHGHSVYFFARYLAGAEMEVPSLKAIISSAETLTAEERRIVEDVFGKIVFDRYGCEEIGLIASECEKHDGLHTAAEGVYVEIIDGDQDHAGRVLVTDLLNHGTPLIRYEIGDLATIKSGACQCGRGLPRIGPVIGRTSDILYTPEGKSISGISILDTMTIHIPGFRQVQVVQEKLDELVFNIVKDPNFNQESLAILSNSVNKYFGPRMRYRVNFVQAIPLTGRGKFQFSICKIDRPQLR